MIRYEFTRGNKCIKHIFFKDRMSCAEFISEADSCDELSLFYIKELDDEIYKRFGETFIYMSKGSEWTSKNYSLLIDLNKSEDQILSEFHKNRRYKVRRCMDRDGVNVRVIESPDEEDIDMAESFYNEFAKSKSLAMFERNRFVSAVDNGIFILSEAFSDEENLLVVNGYLVDWENGCSTFAFGASKFRDDKEHAALIGRANGYLHYATMCRLKELGFGSYDLGGLYVGNDNSLSNISEFKRSLGGTVEEYGPKFIYQKWAVDNVEFNLKRLKPIVSEKKIVIWGYAAWGRYVCRRIKEMYDIDPEIVIDEFLASEENCIKKRDVLNGLNSNDYFVIVTTDIDKYRGICQNPEIKDFVDAGSVLCIKENLI